MDRGTFEEINSYLVTIFNEILHIEENSLAQSDFSDLSIKEMHTIEAIGLDGTTNQSKIAEKMQVTLGTLSVSIQNLVKKGYVKREKLPDDRRVTQLKLSKKGRVLYRVHRQFHLNMVERTTSDLDKGEVEVLLHGLRNLHCYLEDVKKSLEENMNE